MLFTIAYFPKVPSVMIIVFQSALQFHDSYVCYILHGNKGWKSITVLWLPISVSFYVTSDNFQSWFLGFATWHNERHFDIPRKCGKTWLALMSWVQWRRISTELCQHDCLFNSLSGLTNKHQNTKCPHYWHVLRGILLTSKLITSWKMNLFPKQS